LFDPPKIILRGENKCLKNAFTVNLNSRKIKKYIKSLFTQTMKNEKRYYVRIVIRNGCRELKVKFIGGWPKRKVSAPATK
jgi:LEA14-like dessication related protein